MQEVFENLVKESLNMYDDAIRHTDVVELLKYIKVQRDLAAKHHAEVTCILQESRIAGKGEDQNMVREILDFARIIETLDYTIDLIESGKFAKEWS